MMKLQIEQQLSKFFSKPIKVRSASIYLVNGNSGKLGRFELNEHGLIAFSPSGDTFTYYPMSSIQSVQIEEETS